MEVTTYGVVLFAHIALVITSFMLVAVLHTCLLMLRRADTVAAMRPWAPVLHRVEPLLPISALGILLLGAWLISLSDGEFAWTDGWVLTSLIALVAVEVLGALVGPRTRRLREAIGAAPEGGVGAELRSLALDPFPWFVAHTGTAAFLGVVFLMAAKPTAAWSVVVVVVAAVLGIASALPFLREASDRRTAPPAAWAGR